MTPLRLRSSSPEPTAAPAHGWYGASSDRPRNHGARDLLCSRRRGQDHRVPRPPQCDRDDDAARPHARLKLPREARQRRLLISAGRHLRARHSLRCKVRFAVLALSAWIATVGLRDARSERSENERLARHIVSTVLGRTRRPFRGRQDHLSSRGTGPLPRPDWRRSKSWLIMNRAYNAQSKAHKRVDDRVEVTGLRQA